MKKVCLVTYTRKKEKFTEELVKMGNFLNREFGEFKCILFSEANVIIPKNAEFEVEQIYMEGTKYRKLIYLMENDDSYFYISVDNDINAQLDNLKEFVYGMINDDADIGWGKIMANPKSNFISQLVGVDKILSHYLLRPILWKSGWGISIPGQCFMLKRKSFKGKLLDVDTFLDDLALGLFVNRHNKELKVFQSKKILGYEEPNDSFQGLWKQRSRWAKGFSTIIDGVKDPVEKKLVSIHGLSYHALWIINWINMILFSFVNPIVSVVYILFMAVLLTRGQVGRLIYGIIYQFVFPIFHMRWMYCLKRG